MPSHTEFSIFAIRIPGTDKYFPPIPKGQRRGGCTTEPIFCPIPRFFPTLRAAKAFIGQWRRGIIKKEYSPNYGTGLIPEDPCETLAIEAVPERTTLDLEIVKFQLIEVD